MSTKTELITITNTKMHEYISTLIELENYTGVLGYIVARNMRVLQNECTEYLTVYQQAITKYGYVADTNPESNSELYSIDPSSASFKDFLAMIEPFAEIEHTVPIMRVSYDEVYNDLTAAQLMKFEWLFFDNSDMEAV